MIHSRNTYKRLAASFAISAHDLPTRDKIPVIKEVMGDDGDGLALDLGSGTGFTTYSVFGNRTTVCVDLHAPNLHYYRHRIGLVSPAHKPLCVVARVNELPFKAGVFRFVLCSEVLEHLENDDSAIRELAWALETDGRVVFTVPHSKWGFASFLEFFGVKTVHDAPGPEHHFRVGYTVDSLSRLFSRYGLCREDRRYYLRFFTRLLTDLISLGNLLIQRWAYHRSSWNWADVAELERNWMFRSYTVVFPLLWCFTRLDRLLFWAPGFGLVMAGRKRIHLSQN